MLISFTTEEAQNCWKRDNIKVELEGSSNYKVTVEGSNREDDIICFVPTSPTLITFLSRLFDGATPVFRLQSKSENINPMDKC